VNVVETKSDAMPFLFVLAFQITTDDAYSNVMESMILIVVVDKMLPLTHTAYQTRNVMILLNVKHSLSARR